MGLIIHVDGGARGNPGPAGAGVRIEDDDGRLLHEGGYFLGDQTNNSAEYKALIIALQRAAHFEPQAVRVRSDSELLVRQITGEYQVKSPTLEQLYRQVQLLLLKIPRWALQHVRREHNRRADELANMAMDHGGDVIVFDIDGQAAEPPPRPAERPITPVVAEPVAAKQQPLEGTPPVEPNRAADVRAVQVAVTTCPTQGICPAAETTGQGATISSTLPAGLCVYAAHTILPTLLAMQNTDPREFAAVPTLTVRCMRAGCAAAFALSPLRSSNGRGRKKK